MLENILLYFVKYPAPGKVKTRLARTLGEEEAARIYRDIAERNFHQIAFVSREGMFELVVLYDPPDKKAGIEIWLPGECRYWPQHGEGLGERLTFAFRDAFAAGARRVMALGSDTLGLTPDVLREGFSTLESADVVIGPARDGGYYLIGLSRRQDAIFADIPWSTPDVLSATLRIIEREQWRCHFLKTLEDLDEINSWENVKETHR